MNHMNINETKKWVKNSLIGKLMSKLGKKWMKVVNIKLLNKWLEKFKYLLSIWSSQKLSKSLKNGQNMVKTNFFLSDYFFEVEK